MIVTAPYGRLPDGTPVRSYTLTNARGAVVRLIDYGARVTELCVPDADGRLADVVLGFDRLEEYVAHACYFGCTVGRVANRIAGGEFSLDGVRYHLTRNDGANHLHGGARGFDRVVWEAAEAPGDAASVRFRHQSPDGTEGYPGRLDVSLVLTLTEENALFLEYAADSDRATPVNLTHHGYFNLAGAGDILGHRLQLEASRYTPVDDSLIPTGELRDVTGTAFDFRHPTGIGERLDQVALEPSGYDHNFVLNRDGEGLRLAARVTEPRSGRTLEVLTTEPGAQLYTGNHLDGGLVGKRGVRYPRHAGFTLETQHFPDAVHHPQFPGIILRPGDTYRQTTIFRFGTTSP